MSDKMTVTFWGVRGGYPTPGAATVRYGGNTPCVEVSIRDQTIILDAGTGIIGLGQALARRAHQVGRAPEATLLFSHMHHDHTQGFPFFSPSHLPLARLHILGPDIYPRGPEEILADTMLPPTFPVAFRDLSATRSVHSVRETDVVRLSSAGGRPTLHRLGTSDERGEGDIIIRMMRSYAHPGGVLCYRIEWQGRAVVYATDTEGYVEADQRLVRFARGADLLIHDAQYTEEHYLGLLPGCPTTQGWGHSTPTMACEVARAAGVQQLALFHYEPRYNDALIAEMEARARGRFANTIAPHEGLKLTLKGQPAPLLNRDKTAPLRLPVARA